MQDKIKKSFDKVTSFLNWACYTDFLKGMSLTFSYFLTEEVTLEYPDKEKWIPYQRFRGLHTLNRDEEGRELCVACELCSRACPTDCITVIPMEDDTGRGITDRVAKIWRIDLVRCLYCAYCEDACPTTAVRLGREFETACFEREDTIRNREDLLKPQVIPASFEGGVVVKSWFQIGKDGNVEVVPDITKKRKNFW